MRILNKNETFFDNVDSEIKAYLLGYFYADGYNQVSRGVIEFTQAEENVESVLLFQKFISPNSKITRTNYKPPRQILYALNICSRYMSNSLDLKGCGQAKSLTLAFPDYLTGEMLRHFLRGYFDGDGCIYLKIRNDDAFVVECPIVCSNIFAQSLVNFIKTKFGFDVYYQKLGKNKVCTTVKITGRAKCFIFLNWLYENCEYKLTRKYNKYLEFKRLHEERPWKHYRKTEHLILQRNHFHPSLHLLSERGRKLYLLDQES